MTEEQLRLELERTLREPAPDVRLAAWLLDLAPPESLEAVELRRVLSLELRRRGQS